MNRTTFALCLLLSTSTIKPNQELTTDYGYTKYTAIAIAGIGLLWWLKFTHQGKYIINSICYKVLCGPNKKPLRDISPLQEAYADNDYETINFLLALPDIDLTQDYSKILCDISHKEKYANHRIEFIRPLLDHPKVQLTQENIDHLNKASDPELLKFLINHPKFDPTRPINGGDAYFKSETILHRACRKNQNDIVQALFADGRVVPTINDLYAAYENNNYEIFKLILTRPNINTNEKINRKILHRAIVNNEIEIIKILLANNQTIPTVDDLIEACDMNHYEILKLLENKHTEIIKILLEGKRIIPKMKNHLTAWWPNIKIFKRIIAHPTIDINEKNKYDDTIFDLAYRDGKFDHVTFLLQHKDFKIAKTSSAANGNFFLHLCCNKKNYDFVKTILEIRQININQQYFLSGNTVFHNACEADHKIMQLLLDYKQPHNINIKNDNGDTPLQIAATKNIEIMNLLIDYGANLTQKNQHKQTVLYNAFIHNIVTDINQLHWYHKKYNSQQDYLNAELHAASQMLVYDTAQQKNFISWCVTQGADLNQKNKKKCRPLDTAKQQFRLAAKCASANTDIFINKEKTYHTFLMLTPHCSDIELYWRVGQNNLYCSDVFRKIMGYYKALTVDRDIASGIAIECNIDKKFYDYKAYKHIKNNFKKQLIDQQCTKFGYINPYSPARQICS